MILQRGGLVAVLLFLAVAAFLRGADEAPAGRAKKENAQPDSPEAALRKFSVAPGLKVDLFAAEPDVRNPVAISVDGRGRVYVVESDRRRSSVFDIRGHRDWLDADLSFRTVAERAEFLRRQVSPTNPAVIKRLVGNGGNGNFSDFNQDGVIDWRDLEVQSERIRLLEDTNGDGRPDRTSVFADGFTNLIAGVAAGVLAHGDDVYFACIPDLWRISRSVNGRSVIKGERSSESSLPTTDPLIAESLLSGFGVHIAFGGHDMHGLILGPDGKLYWSIADRGTDTNLFAKIKNPIPGLTPELLADSGCIFRANPDGSQFEVIAWGLRNPQELAFDDYGNLFTADNNGDGGDKARWHYVVEGADFGWRIGWQWLEARAYQPKMGPWNGERLWHLADSNTAAYLLPPLAHIGHGPAGLAYNPGTGLPAQFERHFFLCDFPGHVLTWTNIPDGASFKIGPVKNLFGDLGPTDVAFHPDGGVLVSDWFKSFDKSDKGRIYRIHDPATDGSKAVQETKRLLTEGMTKRSVKELADLLGHADMRVRLEAQWQLALRRDFKGLREVAFRGPNTLARLHGIWGLDQMIAFQTNSMLAAELTSLLPLLKDSSVEIRCRAARLFGRAMFADAASDLLGMMSAGSATEKFHGLMAYRDLRQGLPTRDFGLRLRYDENGRWTRAQRLEMESQKPFWAAGLISFPALKFESILNNCNGDALVQHAAAMLLSTSLDSILAPFVRTNPRFTIDSLPAPVAEIEPFSQLVAHSNGVVRTVALLALRRLRSRDVARFLSDADPQLVLEAARAINDVPIEGAFPQLAALIASDGGFALTAGNSKLETRNAELASFTARRALNANFRLGDATNALALAAFAARDEVPVPLRIEALELLAQWPKPPGRDQIMGLWRPLPPRDGQPAVDALRPVIAALLTNAPGDLRLAAIKTVAALGMKEVDLSGLVADQKQLPEVRVEALRFLATLNDWRYVVAVRQAAQDPSEPLRIAAGKLLGSVEGTGSWQRALESGSLAEKQAALASLAGAAGDVADGLVAKQLDALLAGTLAKELHLDVLEAAGKRASLQPKLAQLAGRSSKEDVLAAFRPALFGGNAENGRKIFVENQQLACFRCHKIQGDGGDVGPDLTGLGEKRGREYLLEAIVQPNKEIAPGFESVLIEMKDGASYAGLVKSETDAELVLNSPEDGLMTLKKSDIKLRQRGLSAMPEELANAMTRRELRDLIEFLATAK